MLAYFRIKSNNEDLNAHLLQSCTTPSLFKCSFIILFIDYFIFIMLYAANKSVVFILPYLIPLHRFLRVHIFYNVIIINN